MSGAITVTPGYTFTSSSDVLNNAKMNQGGNPSMRVNASTIGGRELNYSIVPIDPSVTAVLFEDFVQNAPTVTTVSSLIGVNRLTRVASGNGCRVNSSASTAGYAGTVIFTDCSDAGGSGYCMIRGAASKGAWVLGAGEISVEWKIISPAVLSSGATDTYTLYIGLANGSSSCDAPTDGVYFSYTDTVSSGAWVGMTTASSASTSVVGPTMLVGTPYVLKAVINATASSVEFFVNGTSIGTSTTHIPTTALTYFCGMNDTVSSAQTNNFYVDWVKIIQTFTTNR